MKVSQHVVVASAYQDGLVLREKRRLKAAVESFERAVADEPHNSLAWFWLAATRDNRAMEAEAIPAYERALELGLDAPEVAKAWAWLASSYSKTGRHAEALVAADRAEEVGGYEPADEFRRVIAAVRRRSTKL